MEPYICGLITDLLLFQLLQSLLEDEDTFLRYPIDLVTSNSLKCQQKVKQLVSHVDTSVGVIEMIPTYMKCSP